MSYVGQSIERIEDLRLLRGRGRYVDDLHRDAMLHAAILRSPLAHGLLKKIRVEKAKAMPGVRAVYTAEDVAPGNSKVPAIPVRLMPVDQLLPFEQPVIARTKVRYVGEPMAIVVADTQAQAEDALDAIELDIEPLPAVSDRQSSEKNASLLIEEAGTNIPITYTATKGDALSVRAPYVRRERLITNRHSAVCLEPRGLLATWDGAKTKLTVEGAAKVPFQSRRVISKNMDLPEDCIDMIEGDTGGGFGVRGEFHPEDFLIPWTARKLGRSVKWVEDRRENLLAANHSRDIEAELEIACEKDGTVLALRGKLWVDMGAYARANGTMVPRNCAQMLSGPYRVPNLHIQSTMFLSNKTPVGTYRGPGRFEADFFRERMFDLAARDLGIDPVEFRRKNLARKDEFPFPLATLDLPEKKEELDSGDYQIALERCLKEFGWEEKKKLQGKLVEGRYHGIALSCFIEGGAAGPRESARMLLDPDGGVSVFVGGTSIGQGLETVMLQIAADALGLPMEKLRIFHGSTTYLKEGFGSFHSRSTVMSGTAVLLAAKELKEEIAKRTGRKVDALRDVDLKSLAPISIESTFHNHRHTYASGACAAHVAVDPRTGDVRLVDYVTVEDVGKIVNPLLANGQIVGAVVQGLGGALLEHFQYDENGQFLTGSLADYLLPTSTDFPSVRAFVLEDAPSPINPLGTKGAGEGGIVSVAGVVANAVAAALAPLGAVPRALPLSPPRVWQMIQDARTAA
ncbi:MAG TPA: xanthine dehydrogenase family protein molybdopterin-binding subunit [Burkholderiales bacterium]|nr:xanthine dehydrogenase family protein molybdopterin-binding subunit [Burkholderiales bacterium]